MLTLLHVATHLITFVLEQRKSQHTVSPPITPQSSLLAFSLASGSYTLQSACVNASAACSGIRKQGASCLLCLMLPLTVALAGRALLLTRGSLQHMSPQICSQSFRPRVQKVMNSTMLRYSFVTAPPTDYAKLDCGGCLGEKEMDGINDQRHHQLSQEVTFSKADTNWRTRVFKVYRCRNTTALIIYD